jgi:SAM-dependent methyltransferase
MVDRPRIPPLTLPGQRPDRYDEIGLTYDATRRADPRIEAQIRAALGDRTPILNVGAGTGSYEAAAAGEVIAVEPSSEMIARRPAGSAPVLQARAEELPLEADSVAAALAVLTLHHWSDWRAGLAELRRVTRERIVLLTHAFVGERFWLLDYFPDIPAVDDGRMPRLDEIAAELPGARIETVPVPKDCEDGFLCAWWARPAAYLDPIVRGGISCFPGMRQVDLHAAKLAEDLESGAWHRRYGDQLHREAADYGYRLVVRDRPD